MKKYYANFFPVVIISSLVILGIAHAKQGAEKAAQQAAESWLALIDSGEYEESWETAAESFKAALSEDSWENMMESTRQPLGKLKSRKFKSATYTKSLPNAPEGEYVVIQYETSFENMKSAVETITPELCKDGRWRVAGYYIK